jgi:glycosyltransferase involved in cell wall biosynthesis
MINKKILHVSLRLSGGGTEKQIMSLLLSPFNNKHDHSVAVFHWCKNCIKLKKAGFAIYFIKTKYFSFKSLYTLYKIQKKIKPRVTISWTPTIEFFIFLISIFNKLPLVVNERTSLLCYDKYKIKNYKGNLVKNSIIHNFFFFKVFIVLRSFSLKYCKAIITNSNHMKIYYSRKFQNKKIYKINNIINLQNIKNTKHKNNNFNFLIVCRFAESKNVNLVIDAFREVRKKYKFPKLIIVGKGYDLKKINSEQKNVTIIPHLDNWFNKFDQNQTYFIHPSLYEGQPNSVLEAAASDFPLILSKIPAHTDLFSKSSCLYFNPFSVNNLYSKMVKSLKETNMQKNSRIKSAKKILKNDFKEKNIVTKYNSILFEMV